MCKVLDSSCEVKGNIPDNICGCGREAKFNPFSLKCQHSDTKSRDGEDEKKERFVKVLTAAQDNLKTIGEDAPLVVSLLGELKKSDVNKDEVIKAFVSKVEAIIKEKCQQQENVKAEPSATASTQN